MDLYAEQILDHYKHPRGQEFLSDPTIIHNEKNVSCGDTLTLQLKLEDDVITGLSWTGEGCAISQAGMSLLSEELIGKLIVDAEAMTAAQMKELLGVPVGPSRTKCALLSLHTLKNTLRAARGEEPQSWVETLSDTST